MQLENKKINQPKISLLIPVYNTELFLEDCLDSVVNQTIGLDELEIICVNDGSTDNSLNILNKYKSKYNINVINSPQNEGLAKAYVTSYQKHLTGEKIYTSCYIKFKYGWNLWNKIYRSEIVKKVIDYIPNKPCNYGEDMFIYSMITHYAKTYYGINNELYNYRVGSGISTASFSEKQFKSLANEMNTLNAMKSFHIANNIYNGSRKSFIDNQYEELYSVLSWHFMKSISEECASECFDIMVNAFGIEKTIEKLLSYNDVFSLARRCYGANFLKPSRKDIKNIALFYFNYGNGGVERVMSLLIPILHNLGYNVSLIIEKEVKSEFKLPDYCKKFIISSSDNVDHEQYLKHSKELLKVIGDNNIDLLLYQASNSPYMIYDLLTVKSAGIYFEATTHDFITSPLLYYGKHFAWKPQVLKLCDVVQVITTMEEKVYNEYKINAKYIPNPLTFNIDSSRQLIKKNSDVKNIIWIGRIDDLQKNPNEALEILQEIRRFIPKIKLTMLGSSSNERNKQLQNYIELLGLQKNIDWIKHSKNPEEYYRKADVLLMTSSYEVFPMVIGEAMSYGIPIVCYKMDYVEMIRNNPKGVIQVDPHNRRLAASEIIKLLSNPNLRTNMSDSSIEYINNFSKCDLSSMWSSLIIGLKNNQKYYFPNKTDLSIFFDVTYEHYYYTKTYSSPEKILILTNLFRYFKKFGVKNTLKKIKRYVKKNGLRAALKKEKYKLY